MINNSACKTAVPVEAAMTFSPSLKIKGQSGSAYEIKFLINESIALDIEHWAEEHLAPDRNGEASLDGAYKTTSLYTDTALLDVYNRTSGYRRNKFRVRRYGSGSELYLERKRRQGDRVAKRREIILFDELQQLNAPLSVVSKWPGGWFHQRIFTKGLSPVCMINYDRTAFSGVSDDGPVRVTLDRNISGGLTSEWSFESINNPRSLLADSIILELKFRLAMPVLFKRLVQQMQLVPTGVSKYRHCLEASNLIESVSERECRYA